jgi:hypothetical protein
MNRKIMLFLLVIVINILPGFAADTEKKTESQKNSSEAVRVSIPYTYQDFLNEKAKCSTRDADFTKMRLAFTKSPHYSPSGTPLENKRELSETYYGKKDYTKALEIGKQILDINFLCPETHMICALSYEKLKDSKKAEYHEYVVIGIVDSIIGSGNGKNMQKAFKVITIQEEYFLLSILGLKNQSKRLVNEDNHFFDVFKVKNNKTGEVSEVFFNVDILFDAYAKKFPKQ